MAALKPGRHCACATIDSSLSVRPGRGSTGSKMPGRVGAQKPSEKARLPAIATAEASLQSQPNNLNPLSDLLDSLHSATSSPQSAETAHAAVYSLHRILSSLIRRGRLHGRLPSDREGAARTVRDWLKARYQAFVSSLAAMLHHDDKAIRLASLNILMDLLRTESEQLSSLQRPPAYQFAAGLWSKIMQALLLPVRPEGSSKHVTIAPDLRLEFLTRYLNFYDDIRLYFLRALSEQAQATRDQLDPAQLDKFTSTALAFLEGLSSMPTESSELDAFWTCKPLARPAVEATDSKKRKRDQDIPAGEQDGQDESTGIFDDPSDSGSDDPAARRLSRRAQARLPELLSLVQHKKAFAQAWIALLPLLHLEDDLKRVLAILHRSVIPHMSRPTALMDFLSDACDRGGTTALLALNGLFTLIVHHNLDYPSFYKRLYALLDRQVLHTRYRPRFFRMLDTFLASPLLPAQLVASFAKRLARLSVSAPPAAIITILPFVYNLLKRHPACMVMVHREDDVAGDPFDMQEPDPLETNALATSLWEIAALQSHYLASISTLAKIFSEPFVRPEYDLEDFLDHAYATLFATEMERKIKRPPALNDTSIATVNASLVQIWSFE
ncbi:uncharacterized protein L969DRAFT_94215 [Mixia osmundae IAM 14324]|uniref:CCAAT-binding factor domain-containing protein n=1 Tax=Mixia osmundae (strain CBS 9802 / IAM 14324 / JCM 22182 / KY 12970) TaxID=764103 RepID=G7E6G3_MIXOS|nr:uncharacterized protein L969DRAFT_94215 [Mixia osmundae IAM 14324]KEI40420.1 hypothetical protein L969DRAFT_94215 [Mixia osmundae IAM 14324]GAA98423.1 hypothetical protein E5Q_05109 [Mixia osmundae IAM 14324]